MPGREAKSLNYGTHTLLLSWKVSTQTNKQTKDIKISFEDVYFYAKLSLTLDTTVWNLRTQRTIIVINWGAETPNGDHCVSLCDIFSEFLLVICNSVIYHFLPMIIWTISNDILTKMDMNTFNLNVHYAFKKLIIARIVC